MRTLSDVRAATAGREIAALSFGSQLDGLVAAAADGTPLHPALIWCDRRAEEECAAAAERMDPEELRALTGCNVDPGHVAPEDRLARPPRARGARRGDGLRPARLVGRAGGRRATLAVDPVERLVHGAARPAHPRLGARRPARPSGSIVAASRRCGGADAVLGPVAGWLREATGLDGDTLVVLGAGDEMAATLGAGVVEPGVVCDVLGTAEPVCAVVAEPAHDPTGLVELHPHADPDTWLLENPGWLSGGAYRWFRDELGSPEVARAERRRRRRLRAAQRARRVRAARRRGRVLGAGAGRRDGARVERPRAGGLVRGDGRARARPPRPGAAGGQRARAARRDRGDRRAPGTRRRRSCASAAGRAGGCCSSCARTSPACRCRARTTSRPRRAAPPCSPRRARACIRRRPPRRARWPGRAASPARPDPELRDRYDALHRRHRRLYAALRPLFDAEVA